MTEHKLAHVLRAIADGVPLSEFDVFYKIDSDRPRQLRGWNIDDVIINPNDWEVRRKPQTITVNGFKVPKPLDQSSAPNSLGTVFWPYLTYESLWDSATSPMNSEAQLAVQRGCAHETKEAAIAHAKAMLGIDPEAA